MYIYFYDRLKSKVMIHCTEGSKNISVPYNRGRIALWMAIIFLAFTTLLFSAWKVNNILVHDIEVLESRIEAMDRISSSMEEQLQQLKEVENWAETMLETKPISTTGKQ